MVKEDMDDIYFFIQARVNSSRMPGKMMAPFFENKTILQVIIERLHYHFPENRICLLTTTSGMDDRLVSSVTGFPVEIFRGEEHNVLKRFLDAGRHFGAENIVRICADNPFLDSSYLKGILEASMGGADYLSYSIGGRPVIKTHYGLFVERTKISSLSRVSRYTSDSHYYEHVTNFIYESAPGLFECSFLEIGEEIRYLEGVRLTVDTEVDFKNAQFIFRKLKDTNSFTAAEISQIVKGYPELSDSMQNEIKYNSK